MSFVLTICSSKNELKKTLENQIKTVLKDQLECHLQKMGWLSHNHAVDIYFDSGQPIEHLYSHFKLLFKDQAFDFCVQKQENRKKKLLIADMDSTIVEGETLDMIADEVGIGKQVSLITEQAMNGQLNFEEALRERVGLLKGQPYSLLETVKNKITLVSGAHTLVKTMSHNHAFTALVSGGFLFFTQYIKEKVGFSDTQANDLMIKDQTITGEVREPILGCEAKRQALEKYMSLYNLKKDDCLAVGDGANDVEMLKTAGLGVAYKAKPIVRNQISTCIKHTDLTSLLYFQGYKNEEFIQ